MVRVLAVEPGPQFAVQDVHRGWVEAFRRLGCQVVDLPYSDRLDFYDAAHVEKHGGWVKAFDTNAAVAVASKSIEAAVFEVWPDMVFITSGFFIPPALYQLIRARGITVVLNQLEEPYEATREMGRAALTDICLINDPTYLDAFRDVNPRTFYMPAAHDPATHCPGPPVPGLECDFGFCGTGFDSRVRFFEAVDWTGIDVGLAGHWSETDPSSPLRKFLVHDIEDCFPNDQAVGLYRSARTSANLYRREALTPALVNGWAMGPREVELAACGTWFARQSRPEGDELLPMLPTFTEPGDLGDLVRWALTHPDEREQAAAAARAAVAGRTFDENARALLRLVA